MDVDCCSANTFPLSAGQQFDFVNYQSQQVEVTGCNPPLAALAYSVPGGTSSNPGRSSAQVASGAQSGYYLLSTNCPNQHAPTIQVT